MDNPAKVLPTSSPFMALATLWLPTLCASCPKSATLAILRVKQADKIPSDPVLDIVAQEFAEGGVRLVELAPAVENAENVRGESKQAVQVLLGLLALLQRLLQVAVDPGQGLGAVPIAAPEPDDRSEER